jgi:2-polyprenyl-3-methyl-5-hydroxy-6-metoxy-1,4-benzoquinol methylase
MRGTLAHNQTAVTSEGLSRWGSASSGVERLFRCGICRKLSEHQVYVAREMMFGFQDEFEYFECEQCGCVQIAKVPDNLFRYYPDNYYSFNPVVKAKYFLPRMSWWKRVRKHHFSREGLIRKFYLNKQNRIGRRLEARLHYGPPIRFPAWLTDHQLNLNLTYGSKILDVGCGHGDWLHQLYTLGFSNLQGVDAFIPSDLVYPNGVSIKKGRISDVKGQFDFVMMHHSLEHMPEQFETLQQVKRILKPNRFLLIRIPIASSYAWRKYRTNWVALDPPRHLFLHTINSLQVLAKATGFEVSEVVYDSYDQQFWGSEQYLRNIPLMDERSLMVNPSSSLFSKVELAYFTELTTTLNQNKDGDCACFYLTKMQ